MEDGHGLTLKIASATQENHMNKRGILGATYFHTKPCSLARLWQYKCIEMHKTYKYKHDWVSHEFVCCRCLKEFLNLPLCHPMFIVSRLSKTAALVLQHPAVNKQAALWTSASSRERFKVTAIWVLRGCEESPLVLCSMILYIYIVCTFRMYLNVVRLHM